MLPLRTEFGSEYGKDTASSTAYASTRPRLVLHDTTHDAPSLVPARRKHRHGAERLLMTFAITCAMLFLACTSVVALWNSAVAAYVASAQHPAPVVAVRVAKGDTLWRYAARYGDPNSYILDRVQTIARANHLSATAALAPGQTLHITVQNPVEVAKLTAASRSRVAANITR